MHGFQNLTERYNALWQAKVWHRFEHASLNDLRTRSDAYVIAHREQTMPAREAAERRPFPKRWELDFTETCAVP